MLVAVLLACHGVHETGPSGVVGQVVEMDGSPVVGLTVETLEAKTKTDAEGRFAVAWKDTKVLHFQKDGAWFERRSAPGDAGTEVRLVLPTRRSLAVSCPPTPCSAQLVWRLGPAFEAEATVACDPDAERRLEGVPEGLPEVSCRPGPAAEPLSLTASEVAGRLQLAPPAVSTRLRVEGSGCTVTVGEQLARPEADGSYRVELTAAAWARAACDGRPALPVRVEPGRDVELPWSAEGPVLVLGAEHAGVDSITLVAADWTLPLGRRGPGFPLPDLPTGTYRVLAHGPDGVPPEALTASLPTPSRPGVLAIVQSHSVLAGRLDVSEDGLDERVGTE